MSHDTTATPLIIDLGSALIKAGFANEENPRAVFPSVVGSTKMYTTTGHFGSPYDTVTFTPMGLGLEDKIKFVGREALERAIELHIKHPIQKGAVSREDWDDIESIFDYIFSDELRTRPEDHPVLLVSTSIAANHRESRVFAAETIFNKYGVKNIFFIDSSRAALFASGRTSGVVLDCGFDVTVMTAFESEEMTDFRSGERIENISPQAKFLGECNTRKLGGKIITDWLEEKLRKLDIHPSELRDALDNIKESFGYVAFDFDQETKNAATNKSVEREYELPSGNVVRIGAERFTCTEVLFKPSLGRHEAPGIHIQLHNFIMGFAPEIRTNLYANIVLSGASTKFPGFTERLKKELSALAPPGTQINVIALPNREFSAWVGAAAFANSSGINWVSQREYDDRGPQIVASRCNKQFGEWRYP